MAVEADSVVVSLIADNTQFDANVRTSAATYQQSMDGIVNAAGKAEGAHGRMSLAMNNSRIAMMEFQHIARGTSDQIAAGAPLTQILTEHLGELGEAVELAGGSFGKLGAFLQGPWGLVMISATAILAKLAFSQKEESDTLDALLEKMQKHYDRALLQSQADEIWAGSIDGLIDRMTKLNNELDKANVKETPADKLAVATTGVEEAQKKFENAQQALLKLQGQLKDLQKQWVEAASLPNGDQIEQAIAQQISAVNKQISAQQDLVSKTVKAFALAQNAVAAAGTSAAQEIGKATADAAKHIEDLGTLLRNKLAKGGDIGIVATADLAAAQAALASYIKAGEDAASKGVDLQKVGAESKIKSLTDAFVVGKTSVESYAKALYGVADALEKAAKAPSAAEVAKNFQQAVVGAEGTGANRLGSSAAGIGQFMPSTWETYFKRLYPQQASTMSGTEIDALRNNREVATAIISAATQDYVKVLQAAGQQITEASLYTVHLLGQRDATKLFNAAPGTPTSSFLSPAVLAGNPFLRGTAGQALSRIGSRIGDSNSAVSAGAIALEREMTAEQKKQEDELDKQLSKEADVTDLKSQQKAISEDILHSSVSLEEAIRLGILPSVEAWNKEYDQIKASGAELNRIGAQLIDDVLNPDNWTSFGNVAKTVLHDIEKELITLAAINPLKNLLTGSNLPTLSGSLTKLFGMGGGMSSGDAAYINDTLGMLGYATGGLINGPGSSTSDSIPAMLSDGEYVLSAEAVRRIGVSQLDALNNGGVRHYADGGVVRGYSPTNGSAASPFGAIQPGMVLVQIEASEYFDGRVASVTGPVIAQASVAAANGGATISRRNLGREMQHRLE